MNNFSRFLFFMGIFTVHLKAQAAYIQEKHPWVYFDLGNTVVSTKDAKHIKYIKGAREYMEDLRREGFNIGIISNIPESWGSNYDEKLQSLKKFIQDNWSEERPFDWLAYDDVILPLKNIDMKPAPILFLQAISKAGSCPSIYIGESPNEIEAARAVGMAAKLYDELDRELYIPISRLQLFIIDNYQRDYDKDCFR